MLDYKEFLQKKVKKHEPLGFDIELNLIHPMLFDFQRHIVKKAVSHGKYAVFADCGLGKTIIQIEFSRIVSEHEKKPALILCPLAVAGQTIKEGEKINVVIQKIKNTDKPENTGLYITNYEQLEELDVSLFCCVTLDESSILKAFTGKTKQLIIDKFANTPYKLACTATPSPNDLMELGNHTEFLNIMSRNEMLAMYFVHDGGETAKWRLKGHAEKHFYSFIGSWSSVLEKPSDIGFDSNNERYVLPKLTINEIKIQTEKQDNGKLFNDAAVSAIEFNAELRRTMTERLKATADKVNSSDTNFIIWIKQNEEGEQLRKLIPGAIEVKGSDTPEYKEKMLLGFANNEFRVLITKRKIAQFGLNFQNCSNQIFASFDFSFEALYQAIRRSYRFLQKNDVEITLITTDTMQNVIDIIHEKQEQFNKMRHEMTEIINHVEVPKKIFNCKDIETENYKLMIGDCVQRIKEIPSNSIDYSFFSPPFSSLYTFSDSIEDLSNVCDHAEFFQHFEFLVPELLRTLKPGRNLSMHLTQLTTGIGRDGFLSIIDFRGDMIRLFQKYGFLFHAEVTIWKDPQLAAIRTKNIQLLHKQTKKDSALSRPGLADYIVTFRKEGINTNPVNHDKNGVPFELWTKIASPIWLEISESNTLQFRSGRESEDEKHITPTQLKCIEWSYELWTNPNDTVLTPFMGIGSEVYQAVKMNRKAIGIELKESYFEQSVKNMQTLEKESNQLKIFDM